MYFEIVVLVKYDKLSKNAEERFTKRDLETNSCLIGNMAK